LRSSQRLTPATGVLAQSTLIPFKFERRFRFDIRCMLAEGRLLLPVHTDGARDDFFRERLDARSSFETAKPFTGYCVPPCTQTELLVLRTILMKILPLHDRFIIWINAVPYSVSANIRVKAFSKGNHKLLRPLYCWRFAHTALPTLPR
jgi:hypothetical protein